jgi:hypothetical protein
MNDTLLRRTLTRILIVSAATLACSAPATATLEDDEPAATSVTEVEQKIRRLKRRVKALETEVGELQALNRPVDVDVNCASGTIGNVLAAHANGRGRLTIRVTGTCAEQVTIARSNVEIEGQGAGAIIQATAPSYGIVVTNGAREIAVSNIRLSGGTGSVAVTKGAHAVFTNIVSEQSNLGMVAADNGVLDITASTLRNNQYGVYATRGAAVQISNSVVENNFVGVIAIAGGKINLTSMLPDGSIGSAGVVVRNNTNGGLARTSSTIEVSDSRIENNTSFGLIADSISTLHLFAALNGVGNAVSGNTTAGLLLQKNSGLVVADGTNAITANGIGILCQGNPSYVLPPAGAGNVSGNAGGNVVGCTP